MAEGGVYGDILSAFPELMDTYTVFDMKAKTGGGYGERYNERQVDGVFRLVPGGKMGIMGENRNPNDVGTFWAYESSISKIRQGSYIEVDDEVYVLTKDNSYKKEGGFIRFTAAIVPAVNGKQVSDNTVVDRALNGFK